MASIPIKPEYGPTLGRLLAPRWHAASRLTRALVVVAGAGLLALAVGVALTLENAHYFHGGPAPFSFSYRGLYRTAPARGEDVEVQRRDAHGRLEDSFAVGPLVLPPYTGMLSAELPMYAASYVDALRRRYTGFVLRGEGKTRVNTVPAYAVVYTAEIAHRTVYGRDILLLPERPGARVGVRIVMLTSPTANSRVTSPLLVGTTGVLERPLGTFTFD
jgi:hypothetical protein